ncbi:MAG: DegT/DnrJ/EryC1/StrS family aminotransferase [Lachnospiraceae bacterium]
MIKNNIINVTKSSMPPFAEFVKEIETIWDSHWLTNMGEKHIELEEQLKKYMEIDNLILYTNGHLALENILSSLKLSGEVITTPFTFASTTHAIVRCGLKPVFCDIRLDDYTLDEEKIEELITEKTSAILPVHVYGNICRVEKISKIAEKYHLKVIYDAAHAFGVKYRGYGIAQYGDASMFSFHATKVFHTIEGGAVAFKNAKLKQELDDRKNFGIRGPESVQYVGGNAKMNEFQAAMGLCNLRHIAEEIKKRKRIFERYQNHLKHIEGIKLNNMNKSVQSNYAYFPVLFDSYKYSRDQIYEKLLEKNIVSRKYFYPLTSDFECYKGMSGFNSEETPIARHIAECVLTLPLYADMNGSTVDEICEIIVS